MVNYLLTKRLWLIFLLLLILSSLFGNFWIGIGSWHVNEGIDWRFDLMNMIYWTIIGCWWLILPLLAYGVIAAFGYVTRKTVSLLHVGLVLVIICLYWTNASGLLTTVCEMISVVLLPLNIRRFSD